MVEPAEAAIVQRSGHRYIHERMGLIPVAELLNAEDVPLPFGRREQATRRRPDGERRWTTGTLWRLLHNPAYAGRCPSARPFC